ncbi:hypothetical protein DIURU_001998 [Diutina rugosa]|uniref:Major facilitator superfamily (MFS) profile domain-containing protein n=1 Tax=Diutina rugosa TaxID=5481 RepID=A0A642URX5_DIURU|nr:uncharacterized protein DIURU_001998 [Diutina rugosa]KAA8904046.1 hypothetical protein DIURU_001998 [Diutina rugosa]
MSRTIELQPMEGSSTHHRMVTLKDKSKEEHSAEHDEQDIEQTVSVPDSDDESHDVYPEGGLRAYLVVLGGFFGCIVNLGVLNSIGAVQMWVSGHQLKYYSASTISWIFSIYLALTYMLAIIAGPIFDRYGPRHIMIVSALLMFGGLMGVASATELWQFALGFICLGTGNGLGMSPSISTLSHWFFEKRGTMVGFATSGGSVGGLVFPLMLRYAYSKYGFEWAIRILAFTTLGCMVVATALVKERFRRSPSQMSENHRSTSKWGHLKSKVSLKFLVELDRRYWILVAGGFFAELSLVLIMTYFSTYCIAKGQTESTSLLLVTVWNATGIPGRIVPNFVSDYLGRFNMNVAMILGYTIVIWAVWLPLGHLVGALYAFAAIGGFFSGSILSLLPACLSQITPVREIGIRYGIVNFVLSIANLFGVPIASAIIGQGTSSDYDKFVIFVACLATAGLVLWYVDRGAVAGYKVNIKV